MPFLKNFPNAIIKTIVQYDDWDQNDLCLLLESIEDVISQWEQEFFLSGGVFETDRSRVKRKKLIQQLKAQALSILSTNSSDLYETTDSDELFVETTNTVPTTEYSADDITDHDQVGSIFASSSDM